MLELLSDDSLHNTFEGINSLWLGLAICGLLAALGKAADELVGQAVILSERSGLPKIVIGATIVSLGTTSPEAAVSVLAALQGDPGLALGNAVGSIICDTGLILGVAILISPPLLPPGIVNRQGWLQLAAGVLLVAACWPRDGRNPFAVGGNLSQWLGFVFVGLLVGYLWLSVKWAKQDPSGNITEELADIEEQAHGTNAPVPVVVVKLLLFVGLVVLSSHILIPAIKVAAERLGVPPEIVAATIVAFGTSLPELVTAIVASRKGHGDLAVGNVIGADILNVLFVAGLSAAVTKTGLDAPPWFFKVQFPAMLLILLLFRVGVVTSGTRMKKGFGWLLLIAYLVYTALNFTLDTGGGAEPVEQPAPAVVAPAAQ
ncbi:sodium:calcium antiporter [Adhaeretor mobilis]|uniref:Inner membrane protein YrbG n=1 Tax=Adhaeretor mobilis TaxID=1930276 RepID=A0A517N028_9BACT|nr:sodium:calcium antiporter [Adhaeretor mobilis]QDT00497.1 Inner membrane protein YrbG [Adhaeretor mobilis]